MDHCWPRADNSDFSQSSIKYVTVRKVLQTLKSALQKKKNVFRFKRVENIGLSFVLRWIPML